jgi:menaquinone-dependent protoporphyrinogen IX oxidase
MKKKTIVLYESKTGFTRKYAEWIAEELDAELFPLQEARRSIDAAKLQDYDAVIFGGNPERSGAPMKRVCWPLWITPWISRKKENITELIQYVQFQ